MKRPVQGVFTANYSKLVLGKKALPADLYPNRSMCSATQRAELSRSDSACGRTRPGEQPCLFPTLQPLCLVLQIAPVDDLRSA